MRTVAVVRLSDPHTLFLGASHRVGNFLSQPDYFRFAGDADEAAVARQKRYEEWSYPAYRSKPATPDKSK
jgi:hypothetical protein